MRSLQLKIGALVALAFAASAAPAAAQIVIDGKAEGAYGGALSTQNTKTHFGDSTVGDLVATGGGSEIDQVFAVVSGDRLYVTIAGNLKRDFEKLEVFFDSTAGGHNILDGSNVPFQVDGYCCNGNSPTDGALQRINGMTFDANFSADYYMTFTHGNENVGAGGNERSFWALTAHYAELNNGTAGLRVAAGMQLAPQGLPNVLRFPFDADFDADADADGADFLTWQRNVELTTGASRAQGDADGSGGVDATDLGVWGNDFGVKRTAADLPYGPWEGIRTTSLFGPELPGLEQGELIDKAYALTPGPNGGGGTGNLNDGLFAAELEFVLADDGNGRNRRNMENLIDLRMALDNSNAAGVEGGGESPWQTAGNPGDVTTGLEFSIPLAHLGNPGAGNTIKILAFINNSAHDYASNQFSGDGILDANLGDDGFGGFATHPDLSGVNLEDFSGDQFVSLQVPSPASAVPEPSSVALLGLAAAGLALAARRRG